MEQLSILVWVEIRKIFAFTDAGYMDQEPLFTVGETLFSLIFLKLFLGFFRCTWLCLAYVSFN